MGTDETVFNKIRAARSVAHLRRVFEGYQKLDGQGIEGAVTVETSGNLKRAFLAIGICVRVCTGVSGYIKISFFYM